MILFRGFRFSRFCLRGDFPLWVIFIDELTKINIFERRDAYSHLSVFFEDNTGNPLGAIPTQWTEFPLLTTSKAIHHERNHGMSTGMVSLKAWCRDAAKAVDSIFDQIEGGKFER